MKIDSPCDSSVVPGPLAGLLVLDFGTFVAGSYNALIMGEMGADVVKVEPLEGDPTRQIGPFFKGRGKVFQAWNRNKRGLAIDMRRPEGRDALYQLVKRADILTENFRPGVSKRLGLDYETLSAINPRLIYCTCTGFGSDGPLATHPAFDGVLQAMGGIAAANSVLSGKVCIAAPLVADFSTAALSLSAVLAALYHRERSGKGQRVQASLLQSVMMLMASVYCEPLDAQGVGVGGAFPYGLFETADKPLFIGVASDKFFQLFCDAIGAPDFLQKPCYRSNSSRVENALALLEEMTPYMAKKTAAEWLKIFQDAGIPCGPVHTPEEFFVHPQVEHMRMNPIVEHEIIGRIRMGGSPVCLESSPCAISRAAPDLGEHTEEILREAGIDESRIEALKASGAILCGRREDTSIFPEPPPNAAAVSGTGIAP